MSSSSSSSSSLCVCVAALCCWPAVVEDLVVHGGGCGVGGYRVCGVPSQEQVLMLVLLCPANKDIDQSGPVRGCAGCGGGAWWLIVHLEEPSMEDWDMRPQVDSGGRGGGGGGPGLINGREGSQVSQFSS